MQQRSKQMLFWSFNAASFSVIAIVIYFNEENPELSISELHGVISDG